MDKNHIPRHIAIIMDGNRRWAKEKGLPPMEGHRQGYEQFKKIAGHCNKLGVKILTVYAFSLENWKRSKAEVFYIMNLLRKALQEQRDYFRKNKIKLNAIGQIERLPASLKNLVYKIMEETKNNKERILNLAISYGGREEILMAVKKILKEKTSPSKINEKIFSQYLYTASQPDPDIVIRTSGEQRLSGFLPWQSVYSELYFSPKLWPDFTENDLEEVIKEFQNRQRRFGQ